jgi:thioredoxin-like negative regulator of GroEL
VIPATVAALLLWGPAPSDPPAERGASGVRWERSFDEGLKKAKAAHKPLMVDFWAEWCGWCRRLDRTTYVDSTVVRLSEEFVAVKVDTEGGRREAEIALRYDVTSLPTIAFLSPSGRMVLRLTGYQGPGQFPSTLEQARDKAAQIMGWEAALEHDPRDVAALAGLGVHLFDQELYSESREMLSKAVEADEGRPAIERKKSRLLLAVIHKSYDQDYRKAEGLLKDALAIRPEGDLDPKLEYLLAKTYLASGRPREARKLLQTIMSDHAESPMAQKARELIASIDQR